MGNSSYFSHLFSPVAGDPLLPYELEGPSVRSRFSVAQAGREKDKDGKKTTLKESLTLGHLGLTLSGRIIEPLAMAIQGAY